MHVHGFAENLQGPAELHLGSVHIRIARHDNNRDLGKLRLALQGIHDEFAAPRREVQIEQDQVRGFAAGHPHGDGPVGGFHGLITALAKDGRNPETAILMIFDDENFFHRSSGWGEFISDADKDLSEIYLLTIFTIVKMSTSFFALVLKVVLSSSGRKPPE